MRMGYSEKIIDHNEMVNFLNRLEKWWNNKKVGEISYEFEVFGPCKDIFLNIKGENDIKKVMAKYNDVMNFYNICKKEKRKIYNILPSTFCTLCYVTTINYITDEKELFTAGCKNLLDYAKFDFFDTIYPVKVIYQDDRTTIVYWSDKTKTVVKCSDDDTFSEEAGFALAYVKRFMCGNDKTAFHKDLKNYVGNATVKHDTKTVE